VQWSEAPHMPNLSTMEALGILLPPVLLGSLPLEVPLPLSLLLGLLICCYRGSLILGIMHVYLTAHMREGISARPGVTGGVTGSGGTSNHRRGVSEVESPSEASNGESDEVGADQNELEGGP